MIQQQYYTRARRGIFRNVEGLDSIAKSPGLKNDFILKTLHNFCFYYPPNELKNAAEKDLDRYPKALTCLQAESGDMIIGQSSFVAVDFTGNRDTFFTHNYVIPEATKDDFIRNPSKILDIASFMQSYDIENGQEIPELDDISYKRKDVSIGSVDMLNMLGLDESIFKKLLFATFSSVASKKKVYVSLDTDISIESDHARELMRLLYFALPYSPRRNLGFITYMRDPERKMFINIMFIPKGNIVFGDKNIDKDDYIFDFANKRFPNIENEIKNHPYLDFAWRNLTDRAMGSDTTGFYEFAEEIRPVRKLDIETYDDLYKLWLMYRYNDFSQYESDRESTLKNIMNCIGTAGTDIKSRLHTLFITRFEKEDQDMRDMEKNYLPSIGIVDSFIKYYDMAADNIKEKMHTYLVSIINKGRNMGKVEYVSEIFKKINEKTELFKKIIETIFKFPVFVSRILEEYLKERFGRINKIRDILEEVIFWGKTSVDVIKNGYFREQTKSGIIKILNNEKNKLETCKLIRDAMAKFTAQCPSAQERVNYESYSKNVLDEVNRVVFDSIRLNDISESDLFRLCTEFNMFEGEPKYAIIRVLYDLIINEQNISSTDMLRKLRALDSECLFALKEQIKRFFAGKTNQPNHYETIIFAFRRESDHDDDIFSDRQPEYDCDGIIKFFSARGRNDVYEFIIWAYRFNMFSEDLLQRRSYRSESSRRDVRRSSIDEAVNRYFRQTGLEFLKDKPLKKKMYEVRDLRKIIEDIKDENTNPIIRLLKRNKEMIYLGVIIVLFLCLVTVLSFFIFDLVANGNHKDTPQVNTGETQIDAKNTDTTTQTTKPTEANATVSSSASGTTSATTVATTAAPSETTPKETTKASASETTTKQETSATTKPAQTTKAAQNR